MERVRVVFFGCLLAIGLSFCPSVAFASEGFLGGLEDLTGTRQVEVEQKGYEESYLEGYEPGMREVDSTPVRDLPEDATTVDYINNTVNAYNTVRYGTLDLSLQAMTASFLGNNYALGANMRSMWLAIVVALVFMWWGVRKAKNVVMNAFRKGKITT